MLNEDIAKWLVLKISTICEQTGWGKIDLAVYVKNGKVDIIEKGTVISEKVIYEKSNN